MCCRLFRCVHGHDYSTKWKCFVFAHLMGKTWLLIGVPVIAHHEWAAFQISTGCLHSLFCDLSINIFKWCLVVTLFTPQFSHLLNWDFNVSPPAYPSVLLESRVKRVVKRELAFMKKLLLVIIYSLIYFSNVPWTGTMPHSEDTVVTKNQPSFWPQWSVHLITVLATITYAGSTYY